MKKYQLKIFVPVMYFVATLALFAVYLQGPVTPLQMLGMIMTVVAFMLWIVARVQLADNFSIAAKANQLVTSGLYSKLRHPVYYFSILARIGLTPASANAYIGFAAVAVLVLELVRIRSEEKILRKKFGKQYTEYKKKTWF